LQESNRLDGWDIQKGEYLALREKVHQLRLSRVLFCRK
jgi:hypothetical protein